MLRAGMPGGCGELRDGTAMGPRRGQGVLRVDTDGGFGYTLMLLGPCPSLIASILAWREHHGCGRVLRPQEDGCMPRS